MRPYNERFQQRVKVLENGCWEWLGTINQDGYGIFHYKGKSTKAHRMSVFFKDGVLPEGVMICHTCDWRRCVNPDHLYIGDQESNMADMVRKGRQKKGIELKNAKVVPEDVQKIRIDPRSSRALEKVYGVSRETINRIKSRKYYRHVPDLHEG